MSKKIILIIVEGGTDERLLNFLLNKEKNKRFHVVRGDLFVKGKKGARTIVTDEIKSYIDKSKVWGKDIAQVVQLIDIDGSFMKDSDIELDINQPDDYFFYDVNKEKVVFGSENKMNAVKSTWKKKAEKIEKVVEWELSIKAHEGTKSTVKIPFNLYFNNICLEHVLIKKILRGSGSEEEKNKIMDAFLDQLSKLSDEEQCEWFKKKIPEGTGETSDFDNLRKNPWYPGSTVYHLITLVRHLDNAIDNNLME